MASLASINIKFSTDLAGFSKGMQNVNRGINKASKKLKSLGKGLSVGLTLPLIGLGAASINAFDKQDKAIAQVEAGLKSTQNQVGKTSAELQKMASDLQNNSLFGDEEILSGVTSQLLTFTNIAGEQFNRTQQAALDLSTRLDGDLKSSAIQLGKALNDPVANLSALSRSGIQFSESQKSTINSLVETNRLADAQTIILNELEKQYGGSAAAAAAAGKGALTQLGNILGDITEDFGKVIVEGIQPLVGYLKDMALRFQALSPTTKKWIVILGGVAAAIGPLLALAGTILPAIGTGLALLTGPIGLIVAGLAAIGVVIYKNWAPIKKTLVDIANYFVDLYNESTVFRVAVESVIGVFKVWWEYGKFIFEGLKSLLLGFVDSFTAGFKSIGKIFKAVLTGNFKALPGIIKEASSKSIDNFGNLTDNLKTDWDNLINGIKTVTNDGLEAITSRKKLAYVKENIDASAITEAVKEATAAGLSTPDASGGGGRAKVSGLDTAGLSSQGVAETPLSAIVATLPGEMTIVDEQLIAFQTRMLEFKEATDEILANTAQSFFEGFGSIIAGIAQGANPLKGLVGLILGTIGDMLVQLGKATIAASKAMIALKASFSVPGAGIITGIATIAVGQLIKAFVPKGFAGAFASGGIVGGSSYYGDKLLARVNSGELILNEKQQKSLYSAVQGGGSNNVVIPEVVIAGRDIKLIFDRQNKYDERVGG